MAYHPPAIYGKFLCCHIELDAMITFCPFGEGAEYIRVTLNADNKGVQIESINLSSMKYFSFLASFGKLAYLDLSNKPL